MNRSSVGRILSVLALAGVVALPAPLVAGPIPVDPPYDVVDLGVLDPDYPETVPHALSDAGEVAGLSYVSLPPPYAGGATRAVRWRDGVLQDLGLPPATLSTEARSINDTGEIVGFAQRFSGGAAPILYADRDGDGTKEWSFVFADSRQGYANGINDAGRVVGAFGGFNRAFSLDSHTPGAEAVDLHEALSDLLGPYATLFWSMAVAVNEPGDVLVNYYNGNGDQTALFRGGSDPQPVNLTGYRSFRPVAFNAAGDVIGLANRQEGNTSVTHAVLYSGGTATRIEGLNPDWWPEPKGIDASGRVVGSTYTPEWKIHAFLYENGQAQDLNDLLPPGSGWTLEQANAINDAGEIVGTGYRAGIDGRRGFLLTRLTPARRIANLLATVEGLGLPDGIETSFVTKLEHALAALEAGDTATACSDLQDFINHAEAQSGKKLTVSQAGQIIAEAAAIRAALGCA
jgi:probable HAF family extracellular repeat protein